MKTTSYLHVALRPWTRLWPAIAIGLFWAPPAAGQGHNEALGERFLREAPAVWREYLRNSEMLQGSITYHCVESPTGPDVQHFEYKTNGSGKVVTCDSTTRKEDKQNSWDKEVFGANPRYAFHLRRATPEAPWAVIDLIDLSKDSLPGAWTMRFDRVFATDATGLIRFQGMSLADIVGSEAFRVNRCVPLQRDGAELAEVSFSYEREAAPGWRPGHCEGTLLLDPGRRWCVRSAEYSMRFRGDPRYQSETSNYRFLELAEVPGSLPVPKVKEWQRDFFADATRKDRLVYHTEYDLAVPSRLPADEEFTLSAFGLPEPPGLEWKRPTRWYLWLGLAGIVCLGLGVAVKKVRARARASPGGAG